MASTLDWYGPSVARSDLEEALERIVSMPVWLRSFDGSYASLAHLKDATSELIGRWAATARTLSCRARFAPRSRSSRAWPSTTS
ncbi:deoxyguanosinetriphosphate triphosphohydrolase-like protein [Mycobacteroides abscessus subsp. abscessus]|nr:deoxyguanosinetriphosphate triphosphohydrolase-like protein [Mycobacteroides abscessus subsp. abscessus]